MQTSENKDIKLKIQPYYETKLGKAYLGDTLETIKQIPDNSINLVLTSPPFVLTSQKEYGNKQEQVVLDPFADSNTTGYAAEHLQRKWIACELNEEYMKKDYGVPFRVGLFAPIFLYNAQSYKAKRIFALIPNALSSSRKIAA